MRALHILFTSGKWTKKMIATGTLKQIFGKIWKHERPRRTKRRKYTNQLFSSKLIWLLHQLTAAWKNLRWANTQKVSLHVKIFLNQRHVVIDKWWKVLLTLLTQLIDIFKRERFIHSFNRSTMCKVSLVNLKNCMKKL